MRRSLIFALILLATPAGCDGATAVTGRVVDPAGKPIVAATVKLTQEPDDPARSRSHTVKTDEDGRFSLGMVHDPFKKPPFLFEVSREGFVSQEERLTGMASYQKEIVLQPMEK
jgi:hypothetical protein